MIKSVKVFPFCFRKIITFFFLLHKIQTPGINMPSDLTPWTLTLIPTQNAFCDQTKISNVFRHCAILRARLQRRTPAASCLVFAGRLV